VVNFTPWLGKEPWYPLDRRLGGPQSQSGRHGEVLKLNGTHLLLVYADDVNLLGDNIDTIKKNAEKTKYMLLSHHQNAGQNHNIKIADTSFETLAQFKYLGMTVRDQNLIQEEIKIKSNSGNVCYHSVQNLSSCLLSENVRIRIYKSIILPVVLCGCETRSQTLREEKH
jgi:hypothetical protein